MLALFIKHLKQNWLWNVRSDLLSGIVVALALIPEAIAFSIIAGVDPKVGLYASFCITVVIAFIGGRPGMISAATGAMALAMVTLVKDHGLQYLLAASILTGILQYLAGVFKLGNLMQYVSRSVVLGFVNALAILIFMAQLPEFKGAGIEMYGMVALGLTIIYLFPRISKAIPAPLVSILTLTAISLFFGLDLKSVGDMGAFPDTLPLFLLPDVPFNLETLQIILPYSITLAAIGLLESLMTAKIVDEMTDTSSDKNRECRGQGIANIIAGCFGGMAGCAMIGQSVINVKSGGRGRLSTLFAGLFLLFLILAVGDLVARIPMAALVSVMIMVSIGTFNWSSLLKIRSNPKGYTTVMLVTVLTVVITHDLAIGVFTGVLLSALFFMRKVSALMEVTSKLIDAEHRVFTVHGQVFFASANRFTSSFNCQKSEKKATIDVSRAHFWDLTAIEALDKITFKLRGCGIEVNVIGMNEASATLIGKFAMHNQSNKEIPTPKS